jgi:hypothetical protein
VFDSNEGGSALALIEVSNVSISNDTRFTNNSDIRAKGGVALYLERCIDISIVDSVFSNNW